MNRPKQLLAAASVIVLLTLVSSCGSPSATTTSGETAEATVSIPPTSTPRQITEVDLEKSIYGEGDLPSAYNPGQVIDGFDDISRDWRFKDDLSNFSQPNIAVMRKFDRTDGHGQVAIFVYKSQSQRDTFYQWEADGTRRYAAQGAKPPTTPAHPIANLGDVAVGWADELRLEAIGNDPAKNFDSVFITFKRCSAVVDVVFVGYAELDTTITYAKRIDKRLKSLLCE